MDRQRPRPAGRDRWPGGRGHRDDPVDRRSGPSGRPGRHGGRLLPRRRPPGDPRHGLPRGERRSRRRAPLRGVRRADGSAATSSSLPKPSSPGRMAAGMTPCGRVGKPSAIQARRGPGCSRDGHSGTSRPGAADAERPRSTSCPRSPGPVRGEGRRDACGPMGAGRGRPPCGRRGRRGGPRGRGASARSRRW